MWAVIPVKKVSEAKKRLSPILNHDERFHFFSAMLEDVLSVVSKINLFDNVSVASNCPVAIKIAKKNGVGHLLTSSDKGLSFAVSESAKILESNGIQEMFVIPADIPMVSEQEINRVLEIHLPAPSMTIIPSKDKSGSNCLVLTPPLLIPLSFGPASFDRHLAIAKKKGIITRYEELPGIGFDIDTPDDLYDLFHSSSKTRCQKYLGQIKFSERLV